LPCDIYVEAAALLQSTARLQAHRSTKKKSNTFDSIWVQRKGGGQRKCTRSRSLTAHERPDLKKGDRTAQQEGSWPCARRDAGKSQVQHESSEKLPLIEAWENGVVGRAVAS
jgi:hypothetical protein